MNRNGWTKKASDLLIGKRIVKVKYMSSKEADSYGWYNCPILIGLEDGSWLVPQSDDEANDGGVIALSTKKDYKILPVLGVNHE